MHTIESQEIRRSRTLGFGRIKENSMNDKRSLRSMLRLVELRVQWKITSQVDNTFGSRIFEGLSCHGIEHVSELLQRLIYDSRKGVL